MKDHARTVWTTQRCLVAFRIVAEIHQARMSNAKPPRMSGRSLRYSVGLCALFSSTMVSSRTTAASRSLVSAGTLLSLLSTEQPSYVVSFLSIALETVGWVGVVEVAVSIVAAHRRMRKEHSDGGRSCKQSFGEGKQSKFRFPFDGIASEEHGARIFSTRSRVQTSSASGASAHQPSRFI